MEKCIKCENEIKYSDMSEYPEFQKGKNLPYGVIITSIDVDIHHGFMGHAGDQTEIYSGKMCDQCFLDLIRKDIVILPEGIR